VARDSRRRVRHGSFRTDFPDDDAFRAGCRVPDKIESSIGDLEPGLRYPSADTVDKIYDNLDARGTAAYLLAIPIRQQAGMRDSIRKFGSRQPDDVIGRPGRSADVELTATTTRSTTSSGSTPARGRWWPRSAKVLGLFNDFW